MGFGNIIAAIYAVDHAAIYESSEFAASVSGKWHLMGKSPVC